MINKRRDHFVQQLLIRQFRNERERVFCFDKRERRIPDRVHGNHPRNILYKRGYYTDQLGNLDDALYKPIEDRFAPFLHMMVKDITNAVRQPGVIPALNDWMAAQLSRTQQIEVMIRAYARRVGRNDYLASLDNRDGLLNCVRVQVFRSELKELRSCSWRAYHADQDEKHRFVLSDEAAIKTPPAWATGTMFLVPLSPSVILAGGTERGHAVLQEPSRNILPFGINGLAASFAHRFVYSHNLRELESIEAMFNYKADHEHDSWMQRAIHPNFGLEQILNEATDLELHEFLNTIRMD